MTEVRDPETGEMLPPGSPRGVQALIKLRDVKEALSRAKSEKAGQDLGGQSWEGFKKRVARERQERIKAAEVDAATIEAMSPRQQAEHFAQLQKPGAVQMLASPLPARATIALQDLRTDELKAINKARDERAEKLGIPQKQAKWDAAVDAIEAKRRAGEQRHKAAHDKALKAIRESAEREHDKLGPRPELQEV